MKKDLLYLDHIIEALDRIEKYTAEGREAFLASTLTQDAVVRNLQTMGESTQKLSAARKAAHPEIDWIGLSAIRNILTHEYLALDMAAVWEIIENDLPSFKISAHKLLREAEDEQ
jgi:uncharacterized protein with HEPN domain